MAVLVWLLRRFGWQGVVDFAGMLERWLGFHKATEQEAPVNVEYRDADGKLMDLGPFIHAELRNSRSGAFPLQGGVFIGCDPVWITPGALVRIRVQDNLFREELVVQVDFVREMLFVQSHYPFAALIAKIHRLPPEGEAAE